MSTIGLTHESRIQLLNEKIPMHRSSFHSINHTYIGLVPSFLLHFFDHSPLFLSALSYELFAYNCIIINALIHLDLALKIKCADFQQNNILLLYFTKIKIAFEYVKSYVASSIIKPSNCNYR